MKDVLRPILELTVVFPGLLLAYFPVRSYLKLSPAKLAAGAVPLLLGLCLGGGLLCYHFGLSTAFPLLLITIVTIFLYLKTLRLSLWKSGTIALAVCAVFACLNSLSRAVGTAITIRLQLPPDKPWFCFSACIFYNVICWLTAAAALAKAKQDLTALLASSGRPADALEPHFTCKKCQDTGTFEGHTCICVHKLMQKLRREEIESLSSLSISSFDTMELRYYPNTMDDKLGEPVRSYMGSLLAELRAYAEEFDRSSESLMLFGNAGLGKTHAALAIAGIVLEKDFDVIYVSSPDFFSKLEALHFGADPGGEEETLLQTAAGADLLILDDLGTEFNSNFFLSTLYSLLNNRLGAHLPTIVTTNITDGALLEKLYTEKISSRLSAFVPCLFAGQDIRSQKAQEV